MCLWKVVLHDVRTRYQHEFLDVTVPHRELYRELQINWDIQKSLLDKSGRRLEHFAQITCAADQSFKITSMNYHNIYKTENFNTAELHELQQNAPLNSVNFCNWIPQTIHDGGTDIHQMFFSNDTSFHLYHREENSQNSRYWSSTIWDQHISNHYMILKLIYGMVWVQME
jgi:hypothetical protein